jgi:sulfur carrier protein ThiS adenylyltransferase
MNEFEETVGKSVGKINFHKVQAARIGIAGCGGLGSNCAFNLVRSGFKNFKIADFDKVEVSNLNRQFYFSDQVGKLKVEMLKTNLKRINPDAKIETFMERIKKDNILDIFKDCDIIVESFDTAEDKKMLVEAMLPTGKLIVSASGICGFGRSDEIAVHKLKENLIIIGDLKTSSNCMSPVSPRVNIAAAKQANVILEYVLNS